MNNQWARSHERAMYYLDAARAMLERHDKGQDMVISGEITQAQFQSRSEFFRHEVERYQDLAQSFDPTATLSDWYSK